MEKSLEFFISYAHQDKLLMAELEKHLKPLQKRNLILWSDRYITAGAEWKREINTHLNASHIILLLISPDFVAEYCVGTELNCAMERHHAGEARVIPILLRPVGYEDEPFGILRALPTDGVPVTMWPNRDNAFCNVTEEVKRVAKALLKKDELMSKFSSHCETGQYEEALEVLEQIFKLDIDSAQLYKSKGNVLRAQRQYGKALDAFEQAIELNPNDAMAYCSQGELLNDLKRHEEALLACEKALQGLKRHEEALLVREKALPLNPNYARAYLGKGWALSGLARNKEALIAFDEVVRCASHPELPGEEYYPEHVSRAMRECYYHSSKVMNSLGTPIVISQSDGQRIYSKGTSGYKRPFTHGSIYWSERGGAQPVWWGYDKLHRRHNGTRGIMGFPLTSSMKATPSPQGTTGSFQRFEGEKDYPEDISAVPVRYGASAYYSEKYGTHLTSGSSGVCYERLGGTSGELGFPVSSAERVGPSQHPAKTKGLCKNFEGGRIYWSDRTGAYAVWDAIADLHSSLGGANGRLGFPLSNEMPAEASPQGTEGILQRFEGGPDDALFVGDERNYSKGLSVYSSNHGTYPVWGGIRRCYERLGSTSSLLGFPISLETPAGKSPQGTTGYYQRFEGGIIFWCENYGDGVPVVGSVLTPYDEFGGTEGQFGFPKSPERPVKQYPHMILQEFEGGVICVLRESREEYLSTVLA